ncbi:hypothetical protein RvY_06493-2 [Ramazzottius varieornatus]|uniref:Uncharacterized protein n=1 Tax=Ramazzottius varieornatus TaxID=947166 RepID=A0A1D1UYT3_RAMVA|nr:hypothetical protein RvY_06493-2 [Ramazzottius varieornatus]
MWSNGVWAPELHRINGQFYAADDSNNPMGAYTFIGKIADAGKDWWAIDGTVMQHRNGRNYFIYSGWDKAYNYDPMVQHLFIAEMASPTSIVPGTATLIKSPVFRWETDGQAVVEGPAVVEHNGSYYLLYSAGASWTEYYSTGVMALDGNSNPLNPASWKTTDHTIFPRNEADGVFGPGHASPNEPNFTKLQ